MDETKAKPMLKGIHTSSHILQSFTFTPSQKKETEKVIEKKSPEENEEFSKT